MSKILRTIAGAGAVAMLSLSPVAAFADTSLGVYQTTDRQMDFSLFLCGSNGKELCVTLTGLRGSADIAKTRAFLNKPAVSNAKPTGNNRWKGKMTVSGYTMDGTLTLNPGKNFVMHGCVFVVKCSDFTLIPAQK
jgi:uncharacterized protein (DUF2147 family)